MYDQYAKDVKHQNFYADLGPSAARGPTRADQRWSDIRGWVATGRLLAEWINKAIQSAIGHLHRVCAAQGGWPGSTWRNRA